MPSSHHHRAALNEHRHVSAEQRVALHQIYRVILFDRCAPTHMTGYAILDFAT